MSLNGMNPIRWLQVNSYTNLCWERGAPAVAFQLEQATHHSVTDAQKLQMAREFLQTNGSKERPQEVAFVTIRAGKNSYLQVFNSEGEVKMPFHENTVLAAATVIYRTSAEAGGKKKPAMIFDTHEGAATVLVKRVAVDLGTRMVHRYEIKLACYRGKRMDLTSEVPSSLFECFFSVGKFIEPAGGAGEKEEKKKTNRFAAASAARADQTLAFKGLNTMSKVDEKVANLKATQKKEEEGPVVIPFMPTEGIRSTQQLVFLFESEEAVRKIKFDTERFLREQSVAERRIAQTYLVATAPSLKGKTEDGDDCTFVIRVFNTRDGQEEQATGSTMATLMPYWQEKLQEPKMFCGQLSKRRAHIVGEIGPNSGKPAGDEKDPYNDPKDQVLMQGMTAVAWEGLIPEENWSKEAQEKAAQRRYT
eukprot:CAMPEP_0178994478 /NCGR_PEP_ID=MMETSP0795-20121207/7292_1 /TAXON_ID=88552 /ORGANISM="Amoebophrya sp., Strain Ameob2" /LENGTH=418 /DNA_ID=CAMNT_0020686675 /DNA_START=238 /DNA_END=1494 /DNA_ORIENTATION=+